MVCSKLTALRTNMCLKFLTSMVNSHVDNVLVKIAPELKSSSTRVFAKLYLLTIRGSATMQLMCGERLLFEICELIIFYCNL